MINHLQFYMSIIFSVANRRVELFPEFVNQ